MAEEHVINSVNKFYLDKVLNLAEQTDILATEDIFDARGMKLVAKGSRISRTLQERLSARKLSKPFESSIAVESGVDINVIAEEGRRIAETVAPVGAILRTLNGGLPPLQVLSGIRFGSAMSTMLTIIGRGGKAALEHSVMVSLLAVCLARKRGMSHTDQSVVALAGLLHDIGELYIDPEYLHSTRRLYPHEWRHVVVHPRIGQMLISGLENYPASVAQAVFEHHERGDGGGYPRQLTADRMSPAGQVISAAEMMAGIFTNQEKPLQRAALATKILPGEFARELAAVVSVAARTESVGAVAAPSAAIPPGGDEEARIRALHELIRSTQAATQELLDQAGPNARKLQQMLNDAKRRIAAIERAFSSTGLDACLDDVQSFFEPHSEEILFEAAVVTSEIEWRLRDVARDLSLNASMLDEQEAQALQPLIVMLDGEA